MSCFISLLIDGFYCCFFRSLVALSLILALLLFSPAPLYILDEVDAALDLSHTQNIGQMLRTHFRHSQVISSDIVSLLPLNFILKADEAVLHWRVIYQDTIVP